MEPASIHSKAPRTGSLENPEVLENVPGHVIPILEREFDDFDTESTPLPQGRPAGGGLHQVPPQAGRLRPAPARRPDDPRQAADGRRHARSARRLRRRDRGVRAAAQGPRDDAPEHPDAPHPAPRRREADARDLRGRPVLAGGLRQHDAQRHRRPARGHAGGRAVRHHPLRRRLRPLLRPPPDDAGDAAQGQDGVHRQRRRQRDHPDPRHGVHPARARRRPRRRDPGRRRHLDHAPAGADAVRVRRARQRRLPEGHRGVHADLRPPGLPARQPRPRPDQGADRQDRDRRVPRAWWRRSSRATGSPSATSRWTRSSSTSTRRRCAPEVGVRLRLAQRRPARVRPLPGVQRLAPAPGRLRHRRGQDPPRRPDARAAARPGRDHAPLLGRLRADDRAPEPGAALGARGVRLRGVAGAARAGARRRRRRRDHRRRQLPRHRLLQARDHQLDGAQPGGAGPDRRRWRSTTR